VVELIKVFGYANGGRRNRGATPLRKGKGVGWGREWKGGDVGGNLATGGVGRQRRSREAVDTGGGR
jgi:hypothetical protein